MGRGYELEVESLEEEKSFLTADERGWTQIRKKMMAV
jgi:hypothetical protein